MPVVVKVTLPLGVPQLVLSDALALALGKLGVLLMETLAALVQPFAPVTVTE